jgi:TolB-like protein/DNA-binding winged helix-turn-helix (wHTH) protein/Flp pilus assembly protein TadD
MPKENSHLYEFGEFQADPTERVLFHHGEHVRLQPKTFETLLALLEQAGHVVRKEELMERVWPDAFVEEINLTKNISALRKTLGNGKGAGQFIETIPTVGYRFVAPVREVAQRDTEMRERGGAAREAREEARSAEEENLAAPPLSHPRVPAPPRRIWLWGLTLASLLGCIGAVVYFPRIPSPPPAPASIAVLPFKNLTGDAGQEYFTDGLAEDLTNDLSRLKDLKVIARNSAFTFKGQDVDVREAGRKLNVATVLEGTVQRAGERWQITATLRESQTGRVLLRSEHQSNAEENILAIQKEIRCSVAANLQVVLCGGSADIPKTNNLEAYLAYLKGLYQFNLRTPASLQQAIQHLEQAVKLDPNYALAWATLADAYFVGKWYIPLSNEVIPKIKAAAQQAIALDDTMVYAHFMMAVYWSNQGNMTESEQENVKVRSLDPNYPRSLHSQGITQALEGKYDEGVRLIRQVQQLDPLSLVINTDVGYVYYIARRYDEAIASYRNALTMDAKFSLAHLLLGLALSQKGQHAEAIAEVQQASDRGSEYLAALGNVYARAGRREEALATLEQLQQLARRQYVPPYQFAWIYCGLGDHDQAVASLQKSAREKAGVIDFKHHPVYEPLRGHTRYEQLLRDAPYHW